MTKRKSISKSVRFEVLKRDNFTCQYCGATAPDTVLHVDHIDPVAGGGTNELINLITSCQPCNSGKGAKDLSDDSAIQKQRAQLEDLNERREQLEMMLAWREGLSSLEDDQVNAINEAFADHTGFNLSEAGRADAKKLLKRWTIGELLEGLDASVGTYFKVGSEDADERRASASKAFNYIPRVLAAQKRYADRPHMKDLFYTRAIIRNRMYCNERVAIDLLEQAFNRGAHIEELKDWAKAARNWTVWRNEMESWIDELSADSE